MSFLRWLPLVTAASAAGLLHGQPVPIGDHKQVFLDETLIREAHGIALHVNSPEKAGVVLSGTHTWEDGMIGGYGTVLEDQGKYRMWYTASPASHPKIDSVQSRLCYAESTDGLHWTKPNLGLYEWQGSKANNIIQELTVESTDIMIDPRAAPAERYKIVARLHERSARWPTGTAPAGTGLYMMTSADGLRWTLHPTRVLPFDPDTLNMALYDGDSGQYLAYVRTWNPERRVGVVVTSDLMKPWPYIAGVPAPYPGIIAAPTRDIPEAFGRDEQDPDTMDFYTPAVVKYPGADHAFLMFTSPYVHFPEPPVGRVPNEGTLDIDLAVSRDGRKFHRISREPYIGLGLEGGRESRTQYMFIGLLVRPTDILQYYNGDDFTHGGYQAFAEIRHLGSIFATRQRLDGFVSLDAGAAGGQFATPPVVFSGQRLTLNLDAGGTGEIEVQLEDATGRPIPGYGFADSDPVIQNDLAAVATWRRGHAEVGALAGQPVRLAFRLRLAKLYAFQFRH